MVRFWRAGVPCPPGAPRPPDIVLKACFAPYIMQKIQPTRLQGNWYFYQLLGLQWLGLPDAATASLDFYQGFVGAGLCARLCPSPADCRECLAARNPLIAARAGAEAPPLQQQRISRVVKPL